MERPDSRRADDGVGERIKASGVGVEGLGGLEFFEEDVLLGELLEDTGEVLALLRGSLGSRGVICGCEACD